ncbi:MAG TPA: GAP family protein [Microlunatus sp.]|nr:GAP family protein [Microlunatus sp.]
MLSTIGQLLPVGLAAALSTVPVTVLLVIMMSPRRKVAAAPFALGCVIGTFLVVLVASLAAQFLPEPRQRRGDEVAAVLEMLLGSALVLFGIRTWRRRHRSKGALELPGWASSALDSVGTFRAFGLGLIIEFRPKSALLACVVSLQVHAASRADAGALVVTVSYVLVATSTVTLPVLLAIISPERMEPRLAKAADTLAEDGQLISAVVLLMVGSVVIGSGLQDLG